MGGRSLNPSGQGGTAEVIWQPVRRRVLLHERIVVEIEKVIQDQHLGVGDRLPREVELARLLKVSRASLREAIKTLEAQGRLRVKHGDGTFVGSSGALRDSFMRNLKIKPVDLGELFAMRELLEVPAAGWAANSATATSLAALRTVLEALDEEGSRSRIDLAKLRELDASFHMGIAEASGNGLLVKTMRVLHEMLAVSLETTHLIPGRIARSRQDHGRILKAISSGNAHAAERAMLRHLSEVRKAAVAAAGWVED